MIIKAAVKYKNKIYTGFDHSECFKQLPGEATMSNIEQGFIDEKNNFFDRKQAMLIAKEMGQLTYETNKQTLISEDLHLNWLNKQDQQIAELEQQLEETKSKLRISNSQLASCELELKNFKEDYNKQEKLLSEVLADKSRIQLDLDATKQQLETKNKNCLALYSALYETLAKENDENVASQIDYLTKQDNGKVNDLYKELQVLKQQSAEKQKEIKSLRTKAFVNSTVNEMLELKLRTQPKEIVEKIKNFMDENTYYYEEERFAEYVAEYLDKILEEYEEK